MAESLYVCQFSNGHIKVGRSVEPKARIASHVDRVSCMGVELSDHFIVECVGPSEPREAELIGRCVEAAARRFKSEWFEGLDFTDVCAWATECASLVSADDRDGAETMWPTIIRAIRATGLNQIEIAERCGCNQTSISKLLTGYCREPLYSLGERLLSLRAECSASEVQ